MVRPWANGLDMYRKVPTDLMEGTKRGSILSYISVFVMVGLFIFETKAFLAKRTSTYLALDSNPDDRIRLNFNITMMDLKCEYAVVDVVSVLGENQNVTSNVNKWNVDGDGVRKRFIGRNRKQNDLDQVELYDKLVTESLEELLDNGEDAVSLDPTTYKFALNEHQFAFIDFYASWCSHCRQLAPTWETLAEMMDDAADAIVEKKDQRYHDEDYSDEEWEHAKKVHRPVFIGKIDCVSHLELCREHNIRAYPTLRMYVNGEHKTDYRGHRTVLAFVDWLKEIEDQHLGADNDDKKKLHIVADKSKEYMFSEASEEEKEWAEKISKQKHRRRGHNDPITAEWKDEEHPGCQLYGYLMLDRVPGNFHIQARSDSHDLAPHMTNVSHVIHSLSIGEPYVQLSIERGNAKSIPESVKNKLQPMNGNAYVSSNLHEGFSHYLKVVTTNVADIKPYNKFWKKHFNEDGTMRAYQILQNSQLAYYRNDIVPEAKFIYDLSPISVTYRKNSRHWYDYLTSLMAIIGGTFTVVGMIEGSIRAASRKRF